MSEHMQEKDLTPQTIKETLKLLVKKYKGRTDYFDIRVGRKLSTLIVINQKKVETVSMPSSFGGSVRANYKGGWGFSGFSDLSRLEDSIKKAVLYARKVAGGTFEFVNTYATCDKVLADPSQKEFLKIPLSEKIKLLTSYDELAWSKSRNIVNVNTLYTDSLIWKVFASCEGAFIEQERGYTYSNILVTARAKDVIQRYRERLCDNIYSEIYHKEQAAENAADMAVTISKAPPAKSGIYTVILDQRMSGLLAHEAFGHLSEADNVHENHQLASVMKLGRRFGSEMVTIIDDPSLSNLRGSYNYDDEGVKAAKTVLLDKGVLVGRLHSRETAGKMGETPNGHARASWVRDEPIVRMGNTYFEKGKAKFSQMLEGVKKGLYCVNWQGGETDHERFTFTAGYGIEIENGKIGRIVRDVKLSGNLFETLKNIDMVGDDIEFEGGTCGKMGQGMPNSTGGPHIRIRDVVVIGV